MAHYSKEINRYPPRLYPLGNSHFQKRSMNHNCQLSSLKDLKKYIGETAYNYIRDESQVGVLLKLADSNYVWCAKIVHHFLTQQLAISRMHEIWCLIEGHPLRFSLHEYEDITGLKCHTIESVDKYDLDHTELWDELEVEPTVGPNWFELEAGLKKCHRWTYENKLMLGLLYVVHVGIMGLARTSRIPLSYAVTVMHDDVFEAFPWGRVGFKCLIDSIKIVALENRSYSIHGCVHALAIWAYDSVSELGKKCGKEIVGDDDDDEEKPALLRWNGSRPRFTIGEFLASVKRKKDKLNVNMVSFRPMEEIYPSWPGEEAAVIGECEGEHKPLDNLLSDIMNGTLNPKQWEAVEKKGYKRKMFSESNDDDDDDDDFVDPPKSRKECGSMKGKAKHVGESSDDRREGVGDKVAALDGVLKALSQLSNKLDNMDTNLGDRISAIGTKVDAIDRKVQQVEGEVSALKKTSIAREEKQCAADGDGGGSSGDKNNEPWIAMMKTSSEDGFPISCVVRNPRASSKSPNPMSGGVSTEKTPLFSSVKKEPEDKGNFISSIKKEPTDEPRTHQRIRKALFEVRESWSEEKGDNDYVNLTKIVHPLSEESETSDIIEDGVLSSIFSALFAILGDISLIDNFLPKQVRKKMLSATQQSPFGGYSLVRRIMKDKVISPNAYDPFTKVCPDKLANVMSFVKHDLDNPSDSRRSAARFYLVVMTPKELWPSSNTEFGWLSDAHLAPAMHMLRKRSQISPSPYNERIAFLDPWFVNQWRFDYESFLKDEKKWKFPSTFVDVFNGESPKLTMTHKRWVRDVDLLYFTHNINGNHWVAIEVNLNARRIKVYDSIIMVNSDEVIFDSCKQYSRMIPLLLQAMMPEYLKKNMSTQAFKVYRVKSLPQNNQTGDCGVYALKYIECLALGISFEGLCDATMPAIRAKLGAELYEEVSDMDCFVDIKNRHICF